jgi:hypothetical protein
MTAIVMNTRNAAVTEHDIAFQSITPTHAGDATGLYQLGGATDGEGGEDPQQITAQFLGHRSNLGSPKVKKLGAVYLSLQGDESSEGELIVQLEDGTEYGYLVAVRAAGVSRGVPGKGISQNYLALGYRNVDGADFMVDGLEPDIVETKTRRLA